eukprot:jgi/Galph1/4188/GphlegSOOS_G2823.1
MTAFVLSLPATQSRVVSSFSFLYKSNTKPVGTVGFNKVSKRRVVMAAEAKPKEGNESPYRKIEESSEARKKAEYRGPQGFTPYAETVNGRLAMIGFFTMIAAELLNHSHPSLFRQLEIIFPLDKLPFISNILG